MTVLLTRPAEDNAEIAEALAQRGLPSMAWPLTRIEPVAAEACLPAGCRGILATSGNGLRALAALTPERALPVLAVGDRTARLARELGFSDAESAAGDVTALARLAAARGLSPLYHPAGADRRGDLAEMLAPHGIEVVVQTVYAARPAGEPPEEAEAALTAGRITVVTLWSPRNANLFKIFAEKRPGWRLNRAAAVAISGAAAKPLQGFRFLEVRQARQPERAAILDEIAAAHAAMRR